MAFTIGVLLPRSTDHPSMGFDLLDGLRLRLKEEYKEDVRTVPENIGFGEDKKDVYAKAEKLLMQDDADMIVAYLSPANAELLYPLVETTGKAMIVLDPGMNYPTAAPSSHAVHISLQGIHAAYLAGKKAGADGAKVIMATSFYDGGYRGPWAYTRGIQDAGGTIADNYIGHYKVSEFTVAPFIKAVDENGDSRIAACFSTYAASLFINSLHSNNESLQPLEFYCSSYMMEEQTVATYQLPKGKFYAYVSWASVLDNEHNKYFVDKVQSHKNKTANIFHLLGWEAGIVAAQLQRSLQNDNRIAVKDLASDWSYDSPRGKVTVHPETLITCAPLYFAEMRQEAGEKPRVWVQDKIEINNIDHIKIMNDQPTGTTSGWLNQYLCT